jgi:hypothetical protein
MRSHAGTLHAFHQDLDRAIGQLEHLQDIGQAADFVHVLRHRLILGRRFLGDQENALAGFHRGFKRLDRLGTPDKERDHHVREHHHVAQGQQGRDWVSRGNQAGQTSSCPLVMSHAIHMGAAEEIQGGTESARRRYQFEPDTLGWSA